MISLILKDFFMNIVQTANNNPAFSTLVTAIKAAGLTDSLSGPGPFTVFAPTNDAFAKLPAGAVDDLVKPENREKLAGILKMHVVTGTHMARAFADKSNDVATLGGRKIAIKGKDGKVTVNGAHVSAADVTASNGVIHGIDTVLSANRLPA